MDSTSRSRWLATIYAATIFVSAFLLFQVQPIISKAILPWFGGSPAVWTTAMLFFQTLLFLGYAYAHFSQSLRPRVQTAVHLAILALAVAMLPILPDAKWKPPDGSDPTGRILLLLAVAVGLPYFALSTTGPLVQAWFSRSYPGRSPYRLYSLSNIGSLLALLSYPFLIEPAATLSMQSRCWQYGFWAFAALCAVGAWRALVGRSASGESEQAAAAQMEVAGLVTANEATIGADTPPKLLRRLLWVALPAFASLALLATTNHITQDVTPVPFLWVVPLSLYLLTFIVCFDHARWYWPRTTAVLLLFIILAGFLHTRIDFLAKETKVQSMYIDVGLAVGGMFCLCMSCHGELVRLKPHPRYLTMFYLLISAGGALGGLFVSLVAPHVFTRFVEWDIAALWGIALAVAVLLGTDPGGLFHRQARIFVPGFALLAILVYFQIDRASAAVRDMYRDRPKAAQKDVKPESTLVAAKRNFYGVVSVKEDDNSAWMSNGRILHGLQFKDEPLHSQPTTYYVRNSGVGRAIEFYQARGSVSIGAIGLGTGTLAAYARDADDFTFYEINPQVPELTERWFTYLSDARQRMEHGGGHLKITMGDARLSLETEANATKPPPPYDVLVVDAFSGDAIPMHLLTREAGDVYRKRLSPDGVLAIHITNTYLDLRPVVLGLADYLQMKSCLIVIPSDNETGAYSCDWMLLTHNERLLENLRPHAEKTDDSPTPFLWTDDFSNMFRILR